VDTSPAKRQKHDFAMELDGDVKIVTVRLYRNRLDWDHIRQAEVRCDKSGGINLENVREALGVPGRCHVSRAIV
jgi:hypothetical protein